MVAGSIPAPATKEKERRTASLFFCVPSKRRTRELVSTNTLFARSENRASEQSEHHHAPILTFRYTETMITVKHLTKTYGKKEAAFRALTDVSFEIPEGSSVAIIGKSGSGKSTLMHAMSGLDKPEKGEVLFGERNILNLSRRQLDRFRAQEIGFIFQSFFISPNETALHNVLLPLEIARVPLRGRKAKALAALKDVELTDKAGSLGRNLSGGQKQRLAIARALINQPSVIFADEPTGNLDSTTGEHIMRLLFKLQKERGTTLFIVTHDEDIAARCEILIRIKDGRIESIAHQKQTKLAQKGKK